MRLNRVSLSAPLLLALALSVALIAAGCGGDESLGGTGVTRGVADASADGDVWLTDTAARDADTPDAGAIDSGDTQPLSDADGFDSDADEDANPSDVPADSAPADAGEDVLEDAPADAIGATDVSDTAAAEDGSIDADSAEIGADVSTDIDDGPPPYCVDASGCNDGSACTTDSCVDGVCVHSASRVCSWPAESTAEAANLTEIGGLPFFGEFESDLSGAVWNPVSRELWLCRNNGPSMVWALVEDGTGSYRIATHGGQPAAWEEFGDAEAVAQADFGDANTVFVLSEGGGTVIEVDLSIGDSAVELNRWGLSAELGGTGAEGMTFVPDRFLAEQGFVDGAGTPYVSVNGMEGLMFIGHQNGGELFAYDLNRATGEHVFVGRYATAAAESAGLEFDRSTGQLFIWHDDDFDQLEVAWLSSTETDTGRRMDTIAVYDAPTPIPFASTNIEGIAIKPIDDCRGGARDFFMTIDGGRIWSFFLFADFPC